MTAPRQVKTTLRGTLLNEFEALCENLGLNPSGVLKLAVKKLAQTELRQAASPGIPGEAA